MVGNEFLKLKYWRDVAFILFIFTISFNLILAGPISSYFDAKVFLWIGSFLFLMCFFLSVKKVIIELVSSRKNVIILMMFFLILLLFILTPGAELKKTAFKDYIIMSLALLFVLSIHVDEDKARLMFSLVMVVSIIQFPFVLQQYFFESRQSLSMREFDWDLISGTFGFNPSGGGGNSAGFILFQVFYVVIAIKKWKIIGLNNIEKLAFLLAVLSFFMVEAKVIMVLVIFVALSTYRVRELLNPLRLVVISGLVLSFILLILVSYNSNSSGSNGEITIEEYVTKTYEDYFEKDVIDIETGEVSRISALKIWYKVQDDEGWLIESYIGNGLTSSKISNSHVNESIANGSLINFASTQLATYLWEIGIVGVLIFYISIFSLVVLSFIKESDSESKYLSFMHAGSKFVFLSCLLFPVYSSTLHSSVSSQVVVLIAIMFSLGKIDNETF